MGRRRPAPRRGNRHRAAPRGHWGVVCLFVTAIVAALLLQGYGDAIIGASGAEPVSATAAGDELPPHSIASGGPVLDLTGPKPRALRMPPRTLALTFDDGPDPVWTPRLLDVLRRHRARATFFVVGVRATRRPDLVRRILREGHEIGSHTYAHPDLGSVPGWRRGLELALSQNALAGSAGVRTRIVRPPYSSGPDALAGPSWRVAREAGRQGYLVVLADRDTKDWRGLGAAEIARAARPARGRGAVVMMHDSGGDRGATVAAVDRLLTDLEDDDYRFTTVTEGLRLPVAHVPVSGVARWQGRALVLAQRAADTVAAALVVLIVVAGVLTGIRLVLLLGFAHRHVRRHRRARRSPRAAFTPPVSVVVPAYNEQAGIAATLRSLLRTNYPGELEVIVVDDGSTDATAAIVARAALPGVRLVRQANSGKAAALNTGIGYARHEVCVLVDGDTVFEPGTIGRLVAPLADPRVGAVSGNTKVGNRRGVLGRWQHIEYVIGFNLDRRMFDVLGCMPTVPGAVGAFRRGALAAAGYVSSDTLAEDTDLTMAIYRCGWRVVYEERALAWTEAPATLRQLWRQRYRWCYGTLQSMWKHRGAVLQRGSAGRFGRRCLGYLTLFQVLLPLFAPVVDVFAVYGLVFLDPVKVAGSWLAFVAVQAVAAAYAMRLDGERLRTLWVLPLQQFVYRQLMYLVVIHSVVTALLGVPLRWQVSQRRGVFAGPADAGPVRPGPSGRPATVPRTPAPGAARRTRRECAPAPARPDRS